MEILWVTADFGREPRRIRAVEVQHISTFVSGFHGFSEADRVPEGSVVGNPNPLESSREHHGKDLGGAETLLEGRGEPIESVGTHDEKLRR